MYTKRQSSADDEDFKLFKLFCRGELERCDLSSFKAPIDSSNNTQKSAQISYLNIMADQQPPNIVEGATTGDVEDEIETTAKSAEDRKAAAAMSSLDSKPDEDSASTKNVDQAAIQKAMDRLTSGGKANGTTKKPDEKREPVKKPVVKVVPSDVALLVEELEMSKAQATEFLRAHEGDLSQSLKAYVMPVS